MEKLTEFAIKNRLLVWLVTNIGVISLFIMGNLAMVPIGVLNIVVFVLWALSILGFTHFFNVSAKEVYKKDPNWKMAPGSLGNILTDVFIIGTMLYFGYIFLTIAYLISAIGLVVLAGNVKKLSNKEKD